MLRHFMQVHILENWIMYVLETLKLSVEQAAKAHGIVRRRGSHNF
jgi:hypothetical protein